MKIKKFVIIDTVEKIRYTKDSRVIDVFNDLGKEGYELVDSNQFIVGESARSLINKG